MDRSGLDYQIAGSVSGVAGLCVFLALHALWIMPIWFILPLGVVVGCLGGAAVGTAYHECRGRLPERPWAAVAVIAVISLILLPALVLGELRDPLFTVTPFGAEVAVSMVELIFRFILELLATATITGWLLGAWLGGTKRAAAATALAGFIFALGPGHNIPFIGGTAGVGQEVVLMAAVIGVSALVLVEVQHLLARIRVRRGLRHHSTGLGSSLPQSDKLELESQK